MGQSTCWAVRLERQDVYAAKDEVLTMNDPLSFLSNGAAKSAVLGFVSAVTTIGCLSFVSPAARSTTFDDEDANTHVMRPQKRLCSWPHSGLGC